MLWGKAAARMTPMQAVTMGEMATACISRASDLRLEQRQVAGDLHQVRLAHMHRCIHPLMLAYVYLFVHACMRGVCQASMRAFVHARVCAFVSVLHACVRVC